MKPILDKSRIISTAMLSSYGARKARAALGKEEKPEQAIKDMKDIALIGGLIDDINSHPSSFLTGAVVGGIFCFIAGLGIGLILGVFF